VLFDGGLSSQYGSQPPDLSGDNFHLRKGRKLVGAEHSLDAAALQLLRAQRRDDDELEGIRERGSVYHPTTIA